MVIGRDGGDGPVVVLGIERDYYALIAAVDICAVILREIFAVVASAVVAERELYEELGLLVEPMKAGTGGEGGRRSSREGWVDVDGIRSRRAFAAERIIRFCERVYRSDEPRGLASLAEPLAYENIPEPRDHMRVDFADVLGQTSNQNGKGVRTEMHYKDGQSVELFDLVVREDGAHPSFVGRVVGRYEGAENCNLIVAGTGAAKLDSVGAGSGMITSSADGKVIISLDVRTLNAKDCELIYRPGV